jgi:hypothetical protein
VSLFHADRLIPLNFIVEILYPPKNLDHSLLMELFRTLSSSHGYLNLNLLPEDKGAVFTGQKGNRCEILTEKVVIREETGVVSFDHFRQQTLSILNQVSEKIAPPVFVGQLNIVRMLSPLSPDTPAARFLRETFLRLPEGFAERIGRPPAGVGLRLVFPPTPQEHNEQQLRVEPFFRDQSQIFIENAGRFLKPFREMEKADEQMTATYDFLKSSLQGLFPSP